MIYSVHGFAGSPLSLGNLRSHALAVLGHSTEARAKGPLAFDEEVDRLASTLPAHAVHLIGYSMGARLCLALALRHPTRVKELSLISPNPGLASEEERRLRRQADQVWIALLREKGIEKFVDAWQALPLWDTQRRLPAELFARQRDARLAHDAAQLAFALESLGTGSMPNLWPKLPGLAAPVRILVGALDAKYCEIGLKMAELLPRAKLFVIEDAGHNPVLEKPDAVAALLQEPIL